MTGKPGKPSQVVWMSSNLKLKLKLNSEIFDEPDFFN